MSKSRIKVKLLTIPTRAEAERAMTALASAENKRRQHIADRDEIILSINEDWSAKIESCATDIKNITAGLREWADLNPQEFGKKKSIEMSAGTLGFRTGTPKLKLLRGWTWNKVLETVKSLKMFGQFIRSKEELDKEGIIAAHAGKFNDELANIGVKVDQDESFFIEPNLTDLDARQTP